MGVSVRPTTRRGWCVSPSLILVALLLSCSTTCRQRAPAASSAGVAAAAIVDHRLGTSDRRPILSGSGQARSLWVLVAKNPDCIPDGACRGDEFVAIDAAQTRACQRRRAAHWRAVAAEVSRRAIPGLVFPVERSADCHHGLDYDYPLVGAELQYFAGLTHLEYLDVSYPRISSLHHLGRLDRLRHLRAREASVVIARDAAQFTALRELDLSGEGHTNLHGGLGPLARLTRLESLELEGSGIDDSDLVHLSGLRQLRRLLLHFNPIRGPGLRHLQRLPHLTALNLGGTELDEAALSLLPPSLQRLKLPHLSPKALPRLKGLPMLRYLQLPSGGQDVCHALGGAYSCPQRHDCECRL